MDDKSVLIGPPPEHILETEVHGDISLYDAHREQVLVLNSTASDVWRLCDGEQTFDQILALLGRAYQLDPETLRVDVQNTIDQLVEEGFLPAP